MENISEGNYQLKANEIEKDFRKQGIHNSQMNNHNNNDDNNEMNLYRNQNENNLNNEYRQNNYQQEETHQKSMVKQQNKVREQKYQSQTQSSAGQNKSTYEFTAIKYSFFDEILQIIDDPQLKNKIKNIRFTVPLTKEQALKIDLNKYQNNQITMQKQVGDKSICFVFNQFNINYASNILDLLSNQSGCKHSFDKKEQELTITNISLTQQQFKDLEEQINQEMKIQMKEIKIEEIFQEQPEIMKRKSEQNYFFCSKFLSDIKEKYSIKTIVHQYFNSNDTSVSLNVTNISKYSNDTFSMSEIDYNSDNKDHIFQIFGFDAEKLFLASKEIIKYSSEQIIFDFSVKSQNNTRDQQALKISKQIDEEIIKGKIELMKKELFEQFNSDLTKAGLQLKGEVITDYGIQYKIIGNRDEIQKLREKWKGISASIKHQIYKKQEFQDSFFENSVQEKIENLISNKLTY